MTQQHELVVPGASNLKKEEEQRMYSVGTLNQKLEVLEVKGWGCLQYPHPVIVKLSSSFHFSILHLKEEI